MKNHIIVSSTQYDKREAENISNRYNHQKPFIKAAIFKNYLILSRGVPCLFRTNLRLKTVMLSLLVLVLMFTSACQITPKEKIVIGRQENILDNITSVSSGNFEKIKVPENVSKTYNFSKLLLTYNAAVVVPETTAYSVIKVSRKAFSDAEILSFIERLAGTNDKLYSEWKLSKSEWLEKQVKVKKYVSSGIVKPEYLTYLQKSYDAADEKVNNPLVQFSELPTNNTYSKLYVETENNKAAMFYFQRNGNQFAYFRDMFLETAPASLYKESNFDVNTDTAEHFNWVQPKDPGITQEDAYKQALEYINKLDIELELYNAEPCTVLVDAVDKSVGWRFIFTRKLSNLQVPYRDDVISIDPNALPSYGAPWSPEMCEIVIDQNGLCKLWWQGASHISNVAVNSAALEQFDTIQQRIANQLNFIYGTSTRDNGIGLDIKISKIELGTSLISAQDVNDIGLYIPTWYVDYNIKWSDESEKKRELNTIIFNAIDGSYIEPRVTNEKIMSISK